MIETELPAVSSTRRIRQHFPALQRMHNGSPVAYFDGPGGTQVPQAVVDAVSDYLLRHNGNTHWAFPTSQETDAIVLQAREVLADFLNAAPNEIAFGANMTTLTFHLARALGRAYSGGDEILVTEATRLALRRDGAGLRPRGERTLRGKAEPTPLYAIA